MASRAFAFASMARDGDGDGGCGIAAQNHLYNLFSS
jgi:hypothetical protein